MYGKWPLGTQVAKQFGEEWLEGTYRKYHNDEGKDLYWIRYSNGDTKDLTAVEIQAAIEGFKSRRHQQAVECLLQKIKKVH
jgi:hypothetical protein